MSEYTNCEQTNVNTAPASQPFIPRPRKVNRATGIIGMVISSIGLYFAVLGFIYVLIYASLSGAFSFSAAIGCGIFSLPLSVVGYIFSRSSANSGNFSIFSRLGKLFGLIGMILTGVSVLLGYILMIAGVGALNKI